MADSDRLRFIRNAAAVADSDRLRFIRSAAAVADSDRCRFIRSAAAMAGTDRFRFGGLWGGVTAREVCCAGGGGGSDVGGAGAGGGESARGAGLYWALSSMAVGRSAGVRLKQRRAVSANGVGKLTGNEAVARWVNASTKVMPRLHISPAVEIPWSFCSGGS